MPLEDTDDAMSGRSGVTESCDPESARQDGRDDGSGEEDAEDSNPKLNDDLPLEALTENIYGFVIASLIKDTSDMETNPELLFNYLRPCRILSSFVLFVTMFGMQVFFIVEAKMLVTPTEVMNARQIYGAYEASMYTDGSNVSHTWNTINGYPRGKKGFFNASRFAGIKKEEKDLVCRIPLSQPVFLFGVLYIWTLTVLHSMRHTLNLIFRFFALPTRSSMQGAVVSGASGSDEVVGLSMVLKVALIGGVQMPRLIMSAGLLWLGARWLTATLGFGDVLLNALALEFILNLSGLLYDVMVPFNGKLLVRRTMVPHLHKKEMETCCNMFGMFLVGLAGAVFCFVYMVYLQAVLPYYRWDVREICKDYLAAQLKV